MAGIGQDMKYAVRQLRHNRGLAAVAILTLALGIGATTAIFGIVNGWLLRPLPVSDPGQITVMTEEQSGSLSTAFSYRDYLDFSNQTAAFSGVIGYSPAVVGFGDARRADHIYVSFVTGNYFSVLGVKPLNGRLILPSEGQTPGADPVAVLGYSYWKRRFEGDPGVVGRSVLMDGRPVTIVGVVPKAFRGTFPLVEMDAYFPFSLVRDLPTTDPRFWTDRNSRLLELLGRLKPGVSAAEAQASMNLVAARLAERYPESDRGYKAYVYPERMARPREPHEFARQPAIAALFLLLAGLVLLVACFNVASMLIARGLSRQREMAVRISLGATRSRLLRQTVSETLVLALIGGAAGLALGEWLVSLFGLIDFQTTVPLRFDFGFDWRVFLFAFSACVLTGLVVGLAPAFRAFRANPNDQLREGGARLSGGVRSQRLRRALVVTQLAGSLVLLVMAGMFVRGLEKAESANFGFDPRGVLDLTMNPTDVGYDKAHAGEFYKRLIDGVRAMPGVQSATLTLQVPFGIYADAANVTPEGKVFGPNEHPPECFLNHIGTNYFSTMRIPLLRGRDFTDADDASTPLVAIVNQQMAAELWPSQNPIGKRFRTSDTAPWIQVVGVAGNAEYLFAADRPRPYYYVPVLQNYIDLRTLQVRSSLAPEALAPQVEHLIHSLEPVLPVFDVMPLENEVQGPNGFLLFRIGATVAGGLGMLGLVLAVVGLYGVVAYTVNQRRHEFAIRMAVGASGRDILSGVLWGGAGMVSIGLLIGLAVTVLLARGASRVLVLVSNIDWLTCTLASVLLALVALVACYLPARRATRVDPATALRYE
ncbi:MAG TPA: ABC transporter permease [Candidatus Acidoferrales bacterium]|nr:ABC transporter permease [Candidatus Acidoferrales bacterium]